MEDYTFILLLLLFTKLVYIICPPQNSQNIKSIFLLFFAAPMEGWATLLWDLLTSQKNTTTDIFIEELGHGNS